ncbi:S-layer homology domain-containing protein [Paenibacillus sp. CMAA1739]|uniref:S-layer homology domain-containing protein n=1 Tax=Paenibacillus ottowii TaxID=2315729 RepID=UPI002DBF754E|nr:S-layer homology domain-containing protein [Paenibacillus sp. CMAA1739]MEC4569310.1 S-layer homology domain-containing protein [Paenibacillus sp. CMAA1739]
MADAGAAPTAQPKLIQDGTWSKSETLMDAPENYVGRSSDAVLGYYRSAIQFNMPELTDKVVTKATLRIHISSINYTFNQNPFLTVYGSTADVWSNGAFPLNPMDQPLNTKTGSDLQVGWVDFDVTPFVQQQTDDVVSFALLANEAGNPGDYSEIAYSADDNGVDAPQLILETAALPVVSKMPEVAAVTTEEDIPTSNITITPNPQDSTVVTHYQITNIIGGRLYHSDGVTEIPDGTFITAAEASDGVRFVPTANANNAAGDTFSFDVKAAQSAMGDGLSDATRAVVHVTEVNDAPTAQDQTLSSISEGSGERTIPFAELLAHASAGPNENGQHLTISSVSSIAGGAVRLDGTNVVFTPQPDFNGTAGFSFTVTDDGTSNGAAVPLSVVKLASFPVNSVADVPNVTDALTEEDKQSFDGLILTRNQIDGSDVSYFRISNIIGGTLYKNDGAMEIGDGQFISVTDGEAGLKFTPDRYANSPSGDHFSFDVQSSLDAEGTGISEPNQAKITVSEVNNSPIAVNDTLPSLSANAGTQSIAVDDLLANDTAGPVNESLQHLSIASVENAQGGTVVLDGAVVLYTPNSGYQGPASFDYTMIDNGTTNGALDEKSSTATASFTINSVPTPDPVPTPTPDPVPTLDPVPTPDPISPDDNYAELRPSINNKKMLVGDTERVIASVVKSDSSEIDVTDKATWTSSDTNVATVTQGEIRALSEGNTVISATYSGNSFNVPITVTAVVAPAPSDNAGSDSSNSSSSNGGGSGHRKSDRSSEDFSSNTATSEASSSPVTVPTESVAVPEERVTEPAVPVQDIFNSNVVVADNKVLQNIKSKAESALNSSASVKPSDLQGHWAEKTINTFSKLGIINGYKDGSFRPDGEITRAEFSAIISRIFDISGGNQPVALNDIGNHWAQDAITKLTAAGVLNGYKDGTFRPDQTIVRQEMAVILARILDLDRLKGDTSNEKSFTDLSTSFAADTIKQLTRAGVLSGINTSQFGPKYHASRAEALTAIYNALSLNSEIKTVLESLEQ